MYFLGQLFKKWQTTKHSP